jgi:hypothetical protein
MGGSGEIKREFLFPFSDPWFLDVDKEGSEASSRLEVSNCTNSDCKPLIEALARASKSPIGASGDIIGTSMTLL